MSASSGHRPQNTYADNLQHMSFRSVFIAIVIGFALIVSAFMINRRRPLHGAPPFASLLFPNLVFLSLIALWVLRAQLAVRES